MERKPIVLGHQNGRCDVLGKGSNKYFFVIIQTLELKCQSTVWDSDKVFELQKLICLWHDAFFRTFSLVTVYMLVLVTASMLVLVAASKLVLVAADMLVSQTKRRLPCLCPKLILEICFGKLLILPLVTWVKTLYAQTHMLTESLKNDVEYITTIDSECRCPNSLQ